ncbi:MAG: hypothetical protein ACR2IV_23295 [Bryobacteraceae bacterium]
MTSDHLQFRSELARLWQQIVRTELQEFLPTAAVHAQLLLRADTRDDLAQPGFVGPNYAPNGIVFVSMNPGNGNDGNCGGDLNQYRALEALRDAISDDLLKTFEDLTTLLSRFMPSWPLIRNLVAPVLPSAGMQDLSSIAYMNLFNWRTAQGADLAALYRRCWTHHTQKQIEMLKLRVIVALGKGVRDHLQSHLLPKIPVLTIRRLYSLPRPNNGDGKRDIEAVCAWLRKEGTGS